MKSGKGSFGNKWHFAILLVIVCIALALRLYCFMGFVGLDDAEYARFSHQVAEGTFQLGTYSGPAVFPLRMGIIVPTAILFRLFGVNEWSMVFYPLCLSMLGIFVAYFSTSCLFNNRAGLIAASIWAVLPIELQNATKLLPDLPAAFYAASGITGILLLFHFEIKRRPLLFAGGVLSGSLFGLSWMCKETVAYLAPFCLIFLFMTISRNWKKNSYLWAGVAVGSLGFLLTEMIIYHNITGDWLFRFHEIERNYLQWGDGFFSEGSRWGWGVGGSYWKALAKRLLLTGPKMIFQNNLFLFMPLFGLIACFHALYWKDKSFFIPALWMISLCLMFNFSSSSLSSYMPLALFHRYLYPILLPSILLAAGLIGILVHRENERFETYKERFFWGIVLAVLVMVIGGYQTFRNIRGIGPTKAWTSEVRTVSNLLTPDEQIYTDFISKRGLEFFWHYPEKMKVINFEGMKSPEGIPAGSFVLTNRRYANWLDINSGMWLSDSSGYKKPEFFDQPPPSWKRVWGNANAALYHVR